nr:TlpA disulfide reductase family protein [uncultured Lachnoanaerobaculum sp.]
MAIMMAGAISACNAGSKTANESVSTESQVNSSESTDSKQADESKSADSKKEDVSFPEFSAKTVEGGEISNDVFKDSKLTVVNVWGSWCGPCVQEIPELQKLSENMKDKNVNVIGIAQDAGSNFQAVKEVLDKSKVTYQNIIPSGPTEDFVMSLQAFPTTFFVDSQGKIVYAIQGSKNLEGFTQIVDDLLSKM